MTLNLILKKLGYCNPKNMLIGQINIKALRNKYDPIRSILQNGLCDIFTLGETKLDESFPTAQFYITNFVLHRKDRNAHGGGVITYIRSDLPNRRRYDMELNASGFEFIILEVQLYKKEKWLICSCYKPPCIKDSVFERSFSELLNSLQIESPYILIIWDINFDMSEENILSNICSMSQLAMRRRATSSQRWHPLPRSRSHTQRRADVGSISQAAQSTSLLCSADLGSGLSLCCHRWQGDPRQMAESRKLRPNLQLLKSE